MKTRFAAATLALAALVCIPSAALAHTGAATVSCTGAQYAFAQFGAGQNTVYYRITVDDTSVAAEGQFLLNEAGGTQGHLNVPFTIYGTHRVKAYSWWGPESTANGESRPANSPPLADKIVQCAAAPPSPVATPSPPAPVAPPVESSSTSGAAPTPTPTIAVGGQRVSSPTVRVAVQDKCGARHARVSVTGTQMRQVRFSVKGRPARTVNVAPGARRISVLVALRPRGAPVQKVTTRITFRNGARPRTLATAARRCSSGAVLPQFTG